jgi:tetratricopeptide (TPR) repeat protein
MRRTASCALAIAGLFLITAGSGRAQNFSNDGANAFVQARNYQGLVQYATAWTHAQPNNPDGWAYLGSAYGMYLHQPDKAIEPMKRSIALKPDVAPAWHALGATYVQVGKYVDAIDAFNHAIKLNPNQPNYWNNLAAAYAGMAQWDKASAALDQEWPIAEKLRNVQVWFVLGNAYGQLAQPPQAIKAYRAALQLNPSAAPVWTNLGTMLQWQGDTQGAMQAYNRGASLGNDLGRKDAADLQAAINRANAAPRSDPNHNFSVIVGQIAKQNFEAYCHNQGTLNPNEHLP